MLIGVTHIDDGNFQCNKIMIILSRNKLHLTITDKYFFLKNKGKLVRLDKDSMKGKIILSLDKYRVIMS